jgi:hypothetical protein
MTTATGGEDSERWRRWIVPLALLAVVFAIDFAAMPGIWCIGDPFAWREEARSLVRDHVLHVNAQFAQSFGEPGQYFVVNPKNGLWYSKYGIVNSLMALPPTVLEYMVHGRVPSVGEPSDLLIFNLYNILLSLAACGLLLRITGWYTNRSWVRVVYVLTVCYATFYWFYQRAQDSKIYEILFYTGAFYFLMDYLRGLRDMQGRPDRKCQMALLGAWMFVAALLLTRVVYGLLIPAIWLLVLYAARPSDGGPGWRFRVPEIACLLLPPLLAVGALAWIDQVKFGAPWLTGYHQWRASAHWPTGRWQDGIWGILFDPQASMLLHFPILMFALLALREFYRRYKLDTVVLFVLPLGLFLFLTKMAGWRGEWAYGPRYMIFMLPLLALPFVVFLERLAESPCRPANVAMATVTLVALTYSTYLQYEANRLDFWALYHISYGVDDSWNREMARYFLDHQMGVFNADLIRHKDDLDDLPFVAELEKRGLAGPQLQAYKKRLREYAVDENFYWKRVRSDSDRAAGEQ